MQQIFQDSPKTMRCQKSCQLCRPTTTITKRQMNNPDHGFKRRYACPFLSIIVSPSLRGFKALRLVSQITPRVSCCLGWDQLDLLTDRNQGLGKWLTQSVKCFLAKQDDLSLHTQHSQKEPDMMLTACNPGMKSLRQEGPMTSLASQTSLKLTNSNVTVPISNIKQKQQSKISSINFWPPHTHVCIHAYAHIKKYFTLCFPKRVVF